MSSTSRLAARPSNRLCRMSGTVDSQQRIDRTIDIARSVNDLKSVGNALGKAESRSGDVQEKIGEIKKVVGK